MAKIYSILSKIKTSDNNIFPFVKLRSRFRTGEGQEAQNQVWSSSENYKIKDLDLSYRINKPRKLVMF